MASDGRTKRSQSICAPASASMEALAAPMETTPAPRRRPATRSQSARITGGRSVRQRRQAQQQQLDRETRARYSSEPRLAEAETPPQVRRQASARRRPPAAQHSQPRRSNAFLDVPRTTHQPEEEPDEDSYRLRTFNTTQKGGIVNRGDSFRRRRSRSGSLAPSSPAQSAPETQERRPVALHRVAMVGAPGVGKTALISQFQTSECINAYDRQRDVDSTEQKVSIMLNGEESELYFVNCMTTKEEIDRSEPPDAFVVIYSVVDKASFQRAEQELARLLDCDMLRARPALLVGNKIDLARSRAVSTQDGKCLACTYKAKFIEVSVGINHNVDELLVGILNQIRLKKQQYSAEGGRESSPAHWYKTRGVVRASMKARQMLTWIFGKEDSKFKNYVDSTEQKVSIMLNGEESELYFVNCMTTKEEIDRSEPPDAFVVIYSVVDKASFQRAEQELARLLDCDMLRARPALLVGNKIDLARSRAVSTQDGKCLACTYKAKFIEVSVGINHNVDELLVGILNQIRLKKQQYSAEGGRESSPAHWYKTRGVVRASMKARQMLTWIFGKEDSKFKNCENLNVL